MTVIRFIRSTLSMLGAAIAASEAAKLHRAPDARTLKALGIAQSDMQAIHL